VLLNGLDQPRQQAIAYVVVQGGDSVASDDRLVLESIGLTELNQGAFALEFGFAEPGEIPDLRVTVDFKDGRPIDMWGSD
jgi:hypothetical protein